MNSWNYFCNNKVGRPIHKWKHYFPIYDRHFNRFVNHPCTFLEIGCGNGGSLQMWKNLLGAHAQIIGIDIRPECKEFEEEHINIRIGDQKDIEFLASIIEEFGCPDIVLDDGGHHMDQMNTSFEFLYPRVTQKGIYVVEDLHTAYWAEYGGGINNPLSFMEKIKKLIDLLNAEHTRGELEVTDFTKNTISMHLYDSVCVFEKGRTLPKSAPIIGAE
jgi:cephalosporin hydroxylase